ncbi:MAG: NAD(P)H-dependent oxidoreductase [Alphaproteobacteria bacterium]|jgi:multimeric flavodoxin WrbA|uniref:flavodoxin family protein n=1 Tax=Pacificispira sp. TaxID=2888761 RepID=UPI001B09A375|nr:NAD(P)H-dependent oxidoreductase [Alphaproteobacteria bacterium]MBO6865266.1 NAD(P)H-dependent oxidoreductase [Alphaproteobacteria bacterium]MEC9265964.1 flavodoxin family protein [Pseudomonadota bacterium]
MKRLLIVTHAPSPNTRKLRDAAIDGAREGGDGAVEIVAKPALEAGPEDVLAADGILLGTTENLGYMSGALKDFFDRTYYGVIEEKQGLPFALYIRAGLDGTGTRRAVESIATGLRWKPMRDPLICRGDWQDAFVDECRELGMLAAAGLDAGIY